MTWGAMPCFVVQTACLPPRRAAGDRLCYEAPFLGLRRLTPGGSLDYCITNYYPPTTKTTCKNHVRNYR